ncbi:hypothetical protein AMR72_05235 [Flavobacterium psychrophilum]|nr:hypothetical protein AMR72_05235 [Flavobacterium psychrophilum]AOE51974.1 hypothetical protein ALW18_05230 [Flavobacterium psychrophilum]
MKKFIITSVLAVLPFVSFAQTTAFNKFEDVEGIQAVSINKEMFDMFRSMDSSAKDEKTKTYMDLAGQVDNVKIFTTSEKKFKKQIKEAVAGYLKQNTLQELMSVSTEGNKVKIYVRQGSSDSIIKEGLVFVENDDRKEDAVLISFTGNVNLNDLKDIKDFKGLKGSKGDKGSK